MLITFAPPPSENPLPSHSRFTQAPIEYIPAVGRELHGVTIRAVDEYIISLAVETEVGRGSGLAV